MTARRVTRRPVSRRRARGDAGITLLEVVVSMSILSIVMAVFTTGIVAMYRSANRTEAMSTAQSQLTVAFQRLDKEIRYAAAVSEPGSVGSDWYVEYLTTTGTPTCTQLRLDTSDPADVRLRLRTWQPGVPPPSWRTSPVLASGLRPDQPFFTPPGDSPFQRLEVVLVAAGGSGSTVSNARSDVTFTALNSASAATGYTTACAGERPASS